MIKPIVLILEDALPRVEWFRREFPDIECIWAETVTTFFEQLSALDKSMLRLIILDHDLGDERTEDTPVWDPIGGSFITAAQTATIVSGGTWPMGSDGKNGMHAVRELEGQQETPIIVWSINPVSAPKMAEKLKEKSYITAWIPFDTAYGSRLRAAIASQVE